MRCKFTYRLFLNVKTPNDHFYSKTGKHTQLYTSHTSRDFRMFNFLGLECDANRPAKFPTRQYPLHPAEINPTCGHLWLRLKPNTWMLSDMSLLAAGDTTPATIFAVPKVRRRRSLAPTNSFMILSTSKDSVSV